MERVIWPTRRPWKGRVVVPEDNSRKNSPEQRKVGSLAYVKEGGHFAVIGIPEMNLT